MKNTIIIWILLTTVTFVHARDEVYVPHGFIKQSINLLDKKASIVAIEVSKWRGPEKLIDVKVLDVLHETNDLLKLTRVYDDGFDPIFGKQFKSGSKWILRIQLRTVDGQKQWVVSYYETSYLELVKDTVVGSIAKHKVKKKMKYSDFKALLTKEIAKKNPNKQDASDGN